MLGLLGLLGLHVLNLAFLDFLNGNVVLLVTFVTGLGLSTLDVVEGHTNDGLLDAGGSASSLSSEVVNPDLLVEASPCEGPGELDGLDLLVEEGAGLCGNEEVGLAVLGDMSATATGVDLALSVGAQFSFRNHF